MRKKQNTFHKIDVLPYLFRFSVFEVGLGGKWASSLQPNVFHAENSLVDPFVLYSVHKFWRKTLETFPYLCQSSLEFYRKYNSVFKYIYISPLHKSSARSQEMWAIQYAQKKGDKTTAESYQAESFLSKYTTYTHMFCGTSVCWVDATGITLPGSKGHQDSTLSQHKEKQTKKIKHTMTFFFEVGICH